ncbi:MAG: class I SAM-dependent methyltransferase [Chitinophagaceae bacterium]|nr:class I SAM-dependent methyltransferase [Chitinophagaceae bacterium]
MYSPLKLGFKYVKYLLTAENGKGHGIHSPFVFDFVIHVLNDKGSYYCYTPLEDLRRELLHDDQELEVVDLGAGSRKGTGTVRKVSEIALNALKPSKYSRLLFRMANYYKSHTILELGTSLGITTSYLAQADHAAHILTLEGVPAIARKAKQHFQKFGLNNIELIEGNFDDTLSVALKKMPKIDFVYIDGNHRYEPTLRYFNQIFECLHQDSLVVFDDIHWSAEMEKAWEEIKKDERITLSIDLFFIGIVFFKKEFKVKQHFTIRY